MNIHKIYPGQAGASALSLLNMGEQPMPLAPAIELDNGSFCIAQHHLVYEHTVETLSDIVNDIESIADIVLFCGKDHSGLYIQAGSIGTDNYRRNGASDVRIVYGRKWRIDPFLPTSEIIQTAFLAVKKANEHEVRELLTVKDDLSGKVGTPFSTHVDLPLMARFPELVMQHSAEIGTEHIAKWLEAMRFDGRTIRASHVDQRANGNTVIDLEFSDYATGKSRAGYEQMHMTLVLRKASEATLMHELANALVQHADRLVDEQFTYRGFARFSQSVNPAKISRLSIMTRTQGLPDEQFEQVRNRLNFEVDAQRVPSLGAGPLFEKNLRALESYGPIGGHLPLEMQTGAQVASYAG